MPGFTVALRGLAAPATAFSAWLVAVTFGVGIGLAAAKYLGVAVNSAATANKAEATARAVLLDPTADLGKSSPPSSARRRSSCRPATSGRARRSS